MRLGWNRAEDGVITVYAHAEDGRAAPVADFWLQPIIDKLGMTRADAKALQEQFADQLVSANNDKPRAVTKANLAEYVARRMLAEMADSGSVEAFCENMAGYPELYLSELAVAAVDCVDLCGRLSLCAKA